VFASSGPSAGEAALTVKVVPASKRLVGVAQGGKVTVQLKGPLPSEALRWTMAVGRLDRASGVLFADGEPPRRTFDVPFVITSEDLELGDGRDPEADAALGIGRSAARTLRIRIGIFRARTGERLGEGWADIYVMPPDRGARPSQVGESN